MQMFIPKKIGKTTLNFVVEGRNLIECALEAEKLSFSDVPACGLCKNDNLYLKAYTTKPNAENKTFKYTKIICVKCRGALTFGQVTGNDDIVYLRRHKDSRELLWEAYEERAPKKPVPEQDDLPSGF